METENFYQITIDQWLFWTTLCLTILFIGVIFLRAWAVVEDAKSSVRARESDMMKLKIEYNKKLNALKESLEVSENDTTKLKTEYNKKLNAFNQSLKVSENEQTAIHQSYRKKIKILDERVMELDYQLKENVEIILEYDNKFRELTAQLKEKKETFDQNNNSLLKQTETIKDLGQKLIVPSKEDVNLLQIRAILKTELSDFDLSVRAFRSLMSADIRTMADLISTSNYELVRIAGFGKKSITEVKNLVRSKGLVFGMGLTKYRLDDDVLDAEFNEIIPEGVPQGVEILSNNDSFTTTEQDVMGLVKEGKTSTEIATILVLSKATVAQHRKNINRKLNANNTA